mgnify:CR=1 FL=1
MKGNDIMIMDPIVTSSFINIAGNLTTLALKGTATKIHSKIEGLKAEKDIQTLRNAYDEMINELLSEREEAVRIAQTYQQELNKITISDEDIIYLQETVSKVIDILKNNNLMLANDVGTGKVDAIESFKMLISKDVLKTMQLLGFNYKEAIGIPLTELCANKINSFSQKKKNR